MKPLEAAAYLTISTKTLGVLARKREIPFITIGPTEKHRRFFKEDLDAWLDGKRQEAAAGVDRYKA
jgi:excisionase family DNA binding protein